MWWWCSGATILVLLAASGTRLGLRRAYVALLLKLFEWGRQHIEVAKQLKRVESNEGGAGISTNDEDNQESGAVIRRENLLAPDRGLECSARPAHLNCNGKANNTLVEEFKTSQNNNSEVQSGGESLNVDHGLESGSTTPCNLDFDLSSCLDYIKAGVESIIEDQVTSVFEAEELRSWNLLTRTNRRYEFLSWRLTVIWVIGFVIRYFILLPIRIYILFVGVSFLVISHSLISLMSPGKLRRRLGSLAYRISFRLFCRSLSCVKNFHGLEYQPKANGFCVANHTSPIDIAIISSENCYSLVMLLTMSTAFVGCLPQGWMRRWLNKQLSFTIFNFLSFSLSAVITYHGEPPRPGICVANHTSPIDVLILMCDNSYSLIGQRHGGFLGLLQRALARASPHIWFERSEVKDRSAVTNRLRQHISDPNNPPILIFPEGTCINNTSVMQFKKGSFEVGGVIYPVAIKYDPRFGDAFWNSSRFSMLAYLYMMMTSWAIVCDVWYLPPMRQRPNESAVQFANRVKSVIARQGGLVDLVWDGQLKRMKAKKEWKELQQEEFSRRLKGEHPSEDVNNQAKEDCNNKEDNTIRLKHE